MEIGYIKHPDIKIFFIKKRHTKIVENIFEKFIILILFFRK
jgi:hypothetical protein